MNKRLEIRKSSAPDLSELQSLYSHAFPHETLFPLVHELFIDEHIVISLTGVIDSQIVGHAMFTKCGLSGGSIYAALLGPLAVTPMRQTQGIGSTLVRAGLETLRDDGIAVVCVLGDPAYYSRLGFAPANSITPPYQLPREYDGAWQSQTLSEAGKTASGELAVPRRWQARSLWVP